MIATLNRAAQLRDMIESGEPVSQADVNRLATLQVLDVVVAGREFVEQAIAQQESDDARIADLFSADS